MTRGGHSSTAMALAFAGFAFFGPLAGTYWAIGCIFGSSGPDDAEIVYSTQGGRKSIINHRTWTHQPAVWIALIWFLISRWSNQPLEYIAAGWLAAGLLHLSMDMLTPMGIPLLWPTGQRTSLNLLPKGAREGRAVMIVWAVFTIIAYSPWVDSLVAPAKEFCPPGHTCGYRERFNSFKATSWEKSTGPLKLNFSSVATPKY